MLNQKKWKTTSFRMRQAIASRVGTSRIDGDISTVLGEV